MVASAYFFGVPKKFKFLYYNNTGVVQEFCLSHLFPWIQAYNSGKEPVT